MNSRGFFYLAVWVLVILVLWTGWSGFCSNLEGGLKFIKPRFYPGNVGWKSGNKTKVNF